MTQIIIASAARTPVGSFNGALSSVPAHDLGTVAIRAALERANVSAEDVDEVIMGQVLQAGAGQGPARQASINAGVPVKAPAWSLNQLCGSGLRAVALGYQQILEGSADIVVAGGQESMSQAPHAQNLRGGQKMGDLAFVDTMIKDGLWDAFHGYHMGQTAENIASRGRSPARTRTASPSPRRTRPKRRRRMGGSPVRSPQSPSRAAKATRWSIKTSSSATASPTRASPA